jgi:antitoxin component YwqK of YwqJK toxin-antitoxin module
MKMRAVILGMAGVLGCGGAANPVTAPVAPVEPTTVEPVGPVDVTVPEGVGPDQPEFWRGGVKACEGVGKLYEYEDAYGCGIEGSPTLSIGFDGQGRLEHISRFEKTAEGDSKLEGVLTEYYPGAGRRTEQTYHLGRAEGPVVHYHPNGQKRLEGAYRDDKPEGEFRTWDGAGKELAKFTMTGGTGKWTEWHENGARALETSYVDGKEHGAHLEWFADGAPQREAKYDAGELIGGEKIWRAPGKKQSEGAYQKGRRTGPWRFYDAQGTLERLDVFDDDSRVSTAPHQNGKPVGALGSPGKCATDQGLESELRAQRSMKLRHGCAKRPELFPGVIVLGEFAHDHGCFNPIAYADCDLRKPLNGTQLMARAGWKKALPPLREQLALAYVNEVALAWSRTSEPALEKLPDGGLVLRASVDSPIGMRSDAPTSSSDFLCRISADGKVAAIIK